MTKAIHRSLDLLRIQKVIFERFPATKKSRRPGDLYLLSILSVQTEVELDSDHNNLCDYQLT